MPEHIRQGTLDERNNECLMLNKELALIDNKHTPKNAINEKEKSSKGQKAKIPKSSQAMLVLIRNEQAFISALKDPETGNITSDPQMMKGIIHDFCKQSLSAVKHKTSKQLLDKALRHYPWE